MSLDILTTKSQLGRSVIYTDGQGKKKAARIIGTPETHSADTPVAAPAEGSVILEITAPDGSKYVRSGITKGTGNRQYSNR